MWLGKDFTFFTLMYFTSGLETGITDGGVSTELIVIIVVAVVLLVAIVVAVIVVMLLVKRRLRKGDARFLSCNSSC